MAATTRGCRHVGGSVSTLPGVGSAYDGTRLRVEGGSNGGWSRVSRRSPAWRRSVQRAVHLLFAVALGAFVYSPLRTDATFVLLVQALFFPALVATGLLMWKGGLLRRRLSDR
jgi:hypothetical protein